MLPAPSADALAHSQRVAAHLRALIEDAGGWIPFSRFMEAALYAPGLGYYAAGAMKFGAAGDFVTAPEMTPLFGRTLAHAIVPVLAAPPVGVTTRGEVLELGAGSRLHPVPHNQDDFSYALGIVESLPCVCRHRPARDFQEQFVRVRPHAGTLARGDDDRCRDA